MRFSLRPTRAARHSSRDDPCSAEEQGGLDPDALIYKLARKLGIRRSHYTESTTGPEAEVVRGDRAETKGAESV